MLIAQSIVSLADQGRQLLIGSMTVVPRTLTVLAQVEALLIRTDDLISQIERSREAADKVIISTAGTVASVEPTIRRAQQMVDAIAPSIDLLQPTLDRLAKSTTPREVDALIRLLDHLPDLVDKTIADILPIVESMQSVAPDVHDMLDTINELNELIAKLPGMGRIRRRVEEKQALKA